MSDILKEGAVYTILQYEDGSLVRWPGEFDHVARAKADARLTVGAKLTPGRNGDVVYAHVVRVEGTVTFTPRFMPVEPMREPQLPLVEGVVTLTGDGARVE